MSDERPDQGGPRETDQDQDAEQSSGLEARRASATDGAFPGLRSASDIFGAPRRPDEWPTTRRERREAERVAGATDEVQPLPEPVRAADDDDATQAVSMPEELARPSLGRPVTPAVPPAVPGAAAPVVPPAVPGAAAPGVPPAVPGAGAPGMSGAPVPPAPVPARPESSTGTDLGSRIPPPAAVPPSTTAPHPRSIQLPSAQSSRAERAVEAQEIDDERRRTDPFGVGRDDVDWLGRATGTAPRVEPGSSVPSASAAGAPVPPDTVPPSFTDLLGLPGTAHPLDGSAEGTVGRPFDWTAQDSGPLELPGSSTPSADGPVRAPGAADVAAGETPDGGVDTGVPTQAWSLADLEDATAAPDASQAPGASGVETVPQGTTGRGADTGAPTQAWSLSDVEDAERGGAGPATDTGTPTQAWSLADAEDDTDPDDGDDTDPDDGAVGATGAGGTTGAGGVTAPAGDAAVAAAAVPWWAEPEPTPPPTAAPPLVSPQPGGSAQYPAGHLPPAVGQDLDALIGIRRSGDGPAEQSGMPAPTGDELDQSEWAGRETSDTGVIHDLFGTGAMQQLDEPASTDTGTRMMPVVGGGAPVPGAAPGQAAGVARGATPRGTDGRGNFINEGFGRLQGEGRRGKLLLIWGAIGLIVVLLVAVFLLTKWILGGDPQQQDGPAASPAAAAVSGQPRASASAEAAATPATPVIGFATEAAAPGEHSWRELAGGECLSPFTDAWADTVTVVDCSTPHQGQLTLRKTIDSGTYPGAQTLAAQASTECQSAEALDLTAAGAYSDVQVQGTYPPDQAAWDQGDRFLSCFVSLASGAGITGSLAPTA